MANVQVPVLFNNKLHMHPITNVVSFYKIFKNKYVRAKYNQFVKKLSNLIVRRYFLFESDLHFKYIGHRNYSYRSLPAVIFNYKPG